MGIVAKPYTFSAGGTIVAAELNSDFDILYSEFNGNIDNANFKAAANINGSKLAAATLTGGKLAATSIQDGHLDYSSVKILRAGPNLAGANGERIARGATGFTFVAGTTSFTINFSSAIDGNPSFSATPTVTFGIEHAGANSYTVHVTARTASSITVTVLSSSGADASSGTLLWHAVGAA